MCNVYRQREREGEKKKTSMPKKKINSRIKYQKENKKENRYEKQAEEEGKRSIPACFLTIPALDLQSHRAEWKSIASLDSAAIDSTSLLICEIVFVRFLKGYGENIIYMDGWMHVWMYE